MFARLELPLLYPRPFTWAVTASVVMLIPVGSLSNTPRTSFRATSTYQWSPLQGLVPPLSLKLWKFQSFSFFFPTCYEELLPAIYYLMCIPFLSFQIPNIWLIILDIKSCLTLFLSPDQFRGSCQEWCQKETPKNGVRGWLGS